MRQRENHTRLVGLLQRAQEVSFLRCRRNEEAREVVLVVLDAVFQHFQSVELCSRRVTDGCPAFALVFSNKLRCACRIFRFHSLHARMVGKKDATLLQCYGMRVDFLQSGPIIIRQTADAMFDVQLMLSHHRCPRLAQQVVVVQQRTGNGVLDSKHCYGCGIALHILKHLLERLAADELYLLTVEILMSCNVVKRPQFSLYSYSLHLWLMSLQKNSAFTCYVKRSLIFIVNFLLSIFNYLRPTASQFPAK